MRYKWHDWCKPLSHFWLTTDFPTCKQSTPQLFASAKLRNPLMIFWRRQFWIVLKGRVFYWQDFPSFLHARVLKMSSKANSSENNCLTLWGNDIHCCMTMFYIHLWWTPFSTVTLAKVPITWTYYTEYNDILSDRPTLSVILRKSSIKLSKVNDIIDLNS